jgi:hypothetical protein
MYCKECQNMIVLPAFTEGECIRCKKTFTSANIPANKICNKCYEETGETLCVSCNKEKI